MLPEESLRGGNLDEALARLQDQVRKEPNVAKHRVFLFQLLSVIGRWDRALTQLKVAGDLDAANQNMVQAYQETLRAELVRAQVFAGTRTPLVLGEPSEWVACVIESLRLSAQGNHAGAQALRTKGFDAAPAQAGSINGERFEWIADGDCRLGPILELVHNGRYCWLPLQRVKAIRFEVPKDLRDLVWTPAFLTLATGTETVGFIPTRYPGTDAASDPLLKLSRKTEWQESSGAWIGLGQRCFVTDQGEVSILDARMIEFDADPSASVPEPESPSGANG